jgi:hypothetical protein
MAAAITRSWGCKGCKDRPDRTALKDRRELRERLDQLAHKGPQDRSAQWGRLARRGRSELQEQREPQERRDRPERREQPERRGVLGQSARLDLLGRPAQPAPRVRRESPVQLGLRGPREHRVRRVRKVDKVHRDQRELPPLRPTTAFITGLATKRAWAHLKSGARLIALKLT